MLSMSAMSSGQAGYYLGLAREDYYLEGGEPPGRWFGSGAPMLGLTGQVEPDHLYNLFAGRTPRGDRSLIQEQNHEGKAEHRPGWDLTFSAPKSVSTLWSQADEGSRQVLQEIHGRAVLAALNYLQDTSSFTRRSKGGGILEKVGLTVATFEHSTSRALDPQLHTHALVMNLSLRADGTSGTLSSLHLFMAKMTAGALYRAELAQGLQVRLGLSLHRERSWFEVDEVSEDLIKAFSKRRTAIEEALKATGLSSAEAAAAAAIQTRDAKDGVSRTELFQDWRQEGARHGWSQEEANQLFDKFVLQSDRDQELARACHLAVERLTQDEAFFSERHFVRCLAEEAQTRGLGATDVIEGAKTFLARTPEIIRLGVYRGEERFTTRAMLKLEQDLLESAETRRDDLRHQLRPETTMGLLSKHGELSEEQMKAVWHITAETGALAVVSGMAGTGKTRMLEIARQAWESEGYRVIGAALAARAATELTNGSDIQSETIARTLLYIERGNSALTAKTIFVVDEAGMVATPDMRKLMLLCQHAGAKLVLVGDERQLQPIGPGAPFKELGRRFGRAELVDIRRQNENWARQAVKDMADGKAKDALTAFAERGLLSVSETRAEAMRLLIEAWTKSGEKPENTLILAATRSEVDILNRFAQDERLRSGELEAPHIALQGQKIYVNDRVMFTQNKRTLGIENGAKGTVSAIAAGGERVSIRLDSGEKITVHPRSFSHFKLGYASTTHKAQGATTVKAFVLGGGIMQGRELSYVQASRARLETRIFAAQGETGDEMTALVREMERSRAKEMAASLQPNIANKYHERGR